MSLVLISTKIELISFKFVLILKENFINLFFLKTSIKK
jgi:hypothetical protein